MVGRGGNNMKTPTSAMEYILTLVRGLNPGQRVEISELEMHLASPCSGTNITAVGSLLLM